MAAGQNQQGAGGDPHTQAVADSQTRQLLLVLVPALLLLIGAATSWLQSLGTSHEVSLKEAIATAVKEVLAGQEKAAEGIKQEVKPAAPTIVVQPASTATNPLDGLSTEAADKVVSDYIKSRQEKLKK